MTNEGWITSPASWTRNDSSTRKRILRCNDNTDKLFATIDEGAVDEALRAITTIETLVSCYGVKAAIKRIHSASHFGGLIDNLKVPHTLLTSQFITITKGAVSAAASGLINSFAVGHIIQRFGIKTEATG